MENKDLKELADVDIRTVKKNALIEIKKVKIDPKLEREERISSFMQQIKNPYCFVCDGVIVKIGFTETEDTLEEKLNEYFLSL